MYVLGAVETLYDGFKDLFDGLHWEMRSVTTALVLMMLLAYIVLVGVKQVNAASSVFLAIVLFSVASSLLGLCIFAATGRSGSLGKENRGSPKMTPKWRKDNDLGTTPDFQILIALFFPSCTGIMAGSNRSGVLASPSRSIPTGTLTAIAVTTALYVIVVWAFGTTIDRDFLYERKLAVALVAWPSVTVVKIGIILSSVGAALQSLTGAPRLLYAIASDGTMPILSRVFVPSSAKASDDDDGRATPRRGPFTPKRQKCVPSSPSGLPRVPQQQPCQPQPDKSPNGTLEASLEDPGPIMNQGKSSEQCDGASRSLRGVSALRLSLPHVNLSDSPGRTLAAAKEGPGDQDDVENPNVASNGTFPERDEQGQVEDPAENAKPKKKNESDVTALAVGLTWFIASIPCLAGKLDNITPIVTMFFLLMYATVNLACFFLAYLRSPGFRPTWKYFHWSSALLGFVWCIVLMFYIDFVYALVAIFIGSCTALYVRTEGVTKNWGDASAGVRFQIARDQLLALTEQSTFEHTKNWRPQILVMCKVGHRFNPTRPELLALAGCLKKGQGLLMAHALIDAGTYGSASRALIADAATEVLRLHLHDHNIQGFPRAVVYRDRTDTVPSSSTFEVFSVPNSGITITEESAPNHTGPMNDGAKKPALVAEHMKEIKKRVVHERRALFDAMLASAQSCGVGALRPNTVLLGWPRARRESGTAYLATSCGSPSSNQAHRADFVQTLRDLSAMRKALIVLKGGGKLMSVDQQSDSQPIDIWWVVQDGGLLLLLPWLLQRSKTFGGCRLRVFAVMTGLFAHCWNSAYGGAETVQTGDIEQESVFLQRFMSFVTKMLADVRIQAEIHPVAGLDFVWAAAHVYRDTLGLRGRTTYSQQLSLRSGQRPLSPIAKIVKHVAAASPRCDRKYNRMPFAASSLQSGDAPVPEESAVPFQAESVPADVPSDTPLGQKTKLRHKKLQSVGSQLRSPVLLVGTEDDKLAPLRGFALALNRKMRRHSSSAALVVTNLPYMTHLPPAFFVDYVDLLTDGLESVVLIRGSGKEVVTKYG